jgi:siroheme synthase
MKRKLIPHKLSVLNCLPSDPQMITLKSLRAIRDADVILHDMRALNTIRSYAHQKCVLIDISMQWKEGSIYSLILPHIGRCGNLVLAIDGDLTTEPKGLELLYSALEAEMEIELLPGIFSYQIQTARMGIPLTQRNKNESLVVLSECSPLSDVCLMAKSTATTLIPGTTKAIHEIIKIFLELRGPSEPTAYQENFLTDPSMRGPIPLRDLVRLFTSGSDIFHSLIVIGKVAESPLISSFINLPAQQTT